MHLLFYIVQYFLCITMLSCAAGNDMGTFSVITVEVSRPYQSTFEPACMNLVRLDAKNTPSIAANTISTTRASTLRPRSLGKEGFPPQLRLHPKKWFSLYHLSMILNIGIVSQSSVKIPLRW